MKTRIIGILITTLLATSVLYAYFKACTNTAPGAIVWTKISNTGTTGVVGMTIDANDKIYVASNDGTGFARSIDHGQTWGALNNGASSACHWGIGLNDIGEVISGSLHNGNVLSCNNTNDPHDALRLIGNGNTWTPVSLPNCGTGNPLFPVVVRHVGSVSLIAGSSWPPFRSLDHGATWLCPTTPMPNSCGERLGMQVANDGNTLVLGTGLACGFQYYSTDKGDTWAALPQADPWLPNCANTADNAWNLLPNGQLLLSAGTSCVVANWCYAGIPPNGSYSLCNSGMQAPQGIGGTIATNLAKTLILGEVGAGFKGGCGLYQSVDNGVHWTAAVNGLPPGSLTNCTFPIFFGVLADSQGFMYAIANNGDVYKTTNPV